MYSLVTKKVGLLISRLISEKNIPILLLKVPVLTLLICFQLIFCPLSSF